MKIRYSIPLVGSVSIELGEYPAQFYQLLTENSEIERQKNLYHLGVLQDVFIGMHHTRWDYTMTMLYLINQLTISRLEGLTCEKKIDNHTLSGRDIMQLLALSSNLGHVPGTFAVEKGITRYLIEHEEVKDMLCNFAEVKMNGKNKIDYVSLSKLLKLVKLELWSKNEKLSESDIKLLLLVKKFCLELHFSKDHKKVRKNIYDYFLFTRRVSYHLLDCLYVNLPLQVDYSSFISQIPHTFLKRDQLRSIDGLTDVYTQIIYKEIYHSTEACNSIVNWANGVYHHLLNCENVFEIIKEWLGKAKLEEIIEAPSDERKEIFSCFLPHTFEASFLTNAFIDSQVDKLELETSKVIKGIQTLMMYIPGLKDPILGSSEAGDLVFKAYSAKNDSNRRILTHLALIVVWIYRGFKSETGVGLITKTLLERILQYVTADSNLEVSIDLIPSEFIKGEYCFSEIDSIQILSAGQRKDVCNDILHKANPAWSAGLKNQLAECKVLKALAKRKWKPPKKGISQYWIIAPGRVRFIDIAKRTDKCEFDGALLNISAKKNKISDMVLYLTESKAGRTASKNDAIRDLREKLNKINSISDCSIKAVTRKILKKNAYAEIHL